MIEAMPNLRQECSPPGIPLLDVIMSLCDAMDLVDSQIVNHHHRTAYIAYSVAKEIALSHRDTTDVLWAGLLHDSGAFSLKARLEFLDFEVGQPGQHEELGYRLLKEFGPFVGPANLIRFHHTWWDHGAGETSLGMKVPLGSHILHLADRIAVTSGNQDGVLGRVKAVTAMIKEQSGKMFVPDLVQAFLALSTKPSFWFDMTSPSIRQVLYRMAGDAEYPLSLESLNDLAEVLCRLIDFRSRFTSTHSRGVAAVASIMGRLVGFSALKCSMLEIAGYVHDLGKLAIPLELLEKPGKFTDEDFFIMKAHPYHTFRVLSNISELACINRWASSHHERLDGKGYPFSLKERDLEPESRLMAVADVFTALAEDRPYRKGMSQAEIKRLLRSMAKDNHLDGDMVGVVTANFDEIAAMRTAAQSNAALEYRQLWSMDAAPDL